MDNTLMSHQSPKFQHVGQRYRDFKVIKAIEIQELQCHLCELIHEPSGAKILHLANDDTENLFCLSFQTIPASSNGIAHILEHTVLCGSKKYPAKDPFFSMNRRSLNTFMNALTGSDFTCYPAATQVHKDFYNLLEVYIDAVFHPNLQYYSFLQEGCRLEFNVSNDPTTPLEYKGIVFNEMKGAMASPNARLSEALNEGLFPHLTYGYNSGGDPKHIPSLSYDELKDFHEKFYHPSHCLFFFYGNMPLQEHLDFIDDKVLKNAQKAQSLPPLPMQPRFAKPRYITKPYPISPDEDSKEKAIIAFGWLTCPIKDQETLLALNILEFLLLDTDASPLKMALLRSGLCKQVSSYVEADLSEVPFVLTLRGCEADNAEAIEKLIEITLRGIIASGIPLEHIENALHQLEFHRSEITSDHGPYGLSLFMRSGLLNHHNIDSELGLHIHSLTESIRKKNLINPRYFLDLIKKYLLNNTHKVRIVLIPDNTLAAAEIAEEKSALEKIKSTLTEDQKEFLVEQALQLTKFQEMQNNIDQDLLPKLTLSDVPLTAKRFPLKKETFGNLEIFHHNTFTNGILYADLVYDLPKVSEEDLSFIRAFVAILPQMGCGGRNYAENLEFIQANTGGVGCSLSFNINAHDSKIFTPTLSLKGKALNRKADKLFQLFTDIVTSADFTDLPRLQEVIMKHFIGLQSSFHQNSLRYAINLSASSLDVPSHIANAWYGMEYYNTIKNIAENINTQLPIVSQIFTRLQNQLLCLENPDLVLTCEQEFYCTLKGRKFYGLGNIPTKPSKPWTCDFTLKNIRSKGLITASPIAFTGKVLKTISYTHPNAPGLSIAAYLADNLVLHTKIREQGGAYGGGAVANPMAANFYFYAYRDPNIAATLDAFDESIKTIASGRFTESDLEEAKLEMIQALDAPITPGHRGDLAYGWLREGKTLEMRQEFRDKILNITKEEVVNAVKQHLLPKITNAATVIFAGKEQLEAENKLLEERGMPLLTLENLT